MSNQVHYNNADASRQDSERIRNEAVRLMRDTEEKTVMSQRDADRRIGERLGDEVRKQGCPIILTLCLDILEI